MFFRPAETPAPTASSLSLLNGVNGAYDPLLEVELLQLRASVNALAMQCNHINQQITAEVGDLELERSLILGTDESSCHSATAATTAHPGSRP